MLVLVELVLAILTLGLMGVDAGEGGMVMVVMALVVLLLRQEWFWCGLYCRQAADRLCLEWLCESGCVGGVEW